MTLKFSRQLFFIHLFIKQLSAIFYSVLMAARLFLWLHVNIKLTGFIQSYCPAMCHSGDHLAGYVSSLLNPLLRKAVGIIVAPELLVMRSS